MCEKKECSFINEEVDWLRGRVVRVREEGAETVDLRLLEMVMVGLSSQITAGRN